MIKVGHPQSEVQRLPGEVPADAQSEWFLRRVWLVIGALAMSAGLAVIIWFTIRIWLAVFAGILLAIFLRTMSSWVAKHSSLSHGLSLAIVVIGLISLLAVGSWFLANPIAEQFKELRMRVPEAAERLRVWAAGHGLLRTLGISELPAAGLAARGADIAGKVLDAFASTFDALASIAVILFSGLYIAAQPDPYRTGLIRLFPIRARPRVCAALAEVGLTLQHWLVGQIVSMVAVGLMIGIGLRLLGTPLPLALGIIAGLLDFVPVFGPIAAAIPALLLGFMSGPWNALYVVLLFVLVNQIESHLLIPLIQNYTVSLPPAVTVLALVLFSALFGFLGLLLATPLAATLLVLVRRTYVEAYLERADGDQTREFEELVPPCDSKD